MISKNIFPYKIAIAITSEFIDPLKKSFSTRRNNPKNKKSPPINQSLGLLNSTRSKGKTNIKKPARKNKYSKIEISMFFQYEFILVRLRIIEKLKIMSHKKSIPNF